MTWASLRGAAGEWRHRNRRRLDPLFALLLPLAAALAFLSLAAEVEAYAPAVGAGALPILDAVLVAVVLLRATWKAAVAPALIDHAKRHRADIVISLGAILLLALRAWLGAEHATWLGARALGMDCLKAYLVASEGVRAARSLALRLRLRPQSVFLLTFLLLILAGTALLLSPRATLPERRLRFVDAIFTATSATCVTGLVVVDTGGPASPFTDFGRAVILALIQIGGLGMMTFTAFFAHLLGKGLGVRHQAALKDVLAHDSLGEIGSVVTSILAVTIVCEGVGAVLLYALLGPDLGGPFGAVFHSVSAFCNAGFAFAPDSLVAYRGAVGVNLVILALLTLGGLGFLVIVDLLALARGALGRRRTGPRPRIGIHAKLVLATSALLLLLGFVPIVLVEWNASLAGLPAGERILAAFFQSATTRTAGFNTIDLTLVRDATLWVMIPLMFVGASPGSTGGGMKTSTFAVFVLALIALWRGREEVEVGKRRIPRRTVQNALLIFCAYILMIGTTTFVLACTESVSFLPLFFEVHSAFGTVGLSAGVTPLLSDAGRWVVAAAMFVGRLGPLTLVLATARAPESRAYEYPEEDVLVG